MKGVVSVNSDFPAYLDGREELEYFSTKTLLSRFVTRGDTVAIVHPEDIQNQEKKVTFKKLFTFHPPNRLEEADPSSFQQGNFFLVRQFGENLESEKFVHRFITALSCLENQFYLVMNTASATKYELKNIQKTLDIPFIPAFDINTPADLESVVASGEKIIAKPFTGFMGRGIEFFDSVESVYRVFNNGRTPQGYCFERYIPATMETRIVFIDGSIPFARPRMVEGPPGKEKAAGYSLTQPTSNQRTITQQVIEQTGMQFGSVDFRGEFVLEINGSGLGLVPPAKVKNYDQIQPYDLTNDLIDLIKRKSQ
ncbi:hypothetical protein CMO92_01365 [Candidatus Woesearchaeota archaeon]|nr:hypothetical protein [Candidatus Woesearchaeota archaeon]|tara:strand:+ start:1093 stop:2022 length:930 start_codon:yes stop_codon:yes gene_type:complete